MKQLNYPYNRVLIFTTLIVLACSIPGLGDVGLPGNRSQPAVAISRPVAAQKLAVGRETTVDSVSVDAKGISRVELAVNGKVIRIDTNTSPAPNTPFVVAQAWTPEIPGTYVIQVRAYNSDDIMGKSEPLTIEVLTVVITPTGDKSATPDKAEATVVISARTTPSPPASRVTPTPTHPPSPTPSQSPAIPTPGATVTDTPEVQFFAPTGFETAGRFNEIWRELGGGNSRLGYPTGPEIVDRNYARQHFERGLMFWWDNPEDPDDIWVLDSPTIDFGGGTTSNRYADTWSGGDEHPCPESADGGPVRGFGQLWCERPELQLRLGHPSEPELGSGGRPPYARVQFFQGGVMLHNPLDTEVYVLFSQGDWQRFDD